MSDDLVRVAVVDSGLGIPDSEKTRVFERFYRVDPARSRNTGGTGLGLSIVKHIAADHGGTISVWSKPGRGSTFTLVIPQAGEDSPNFDDEESDPYYDIRILTTTIMMRTKNRRKSLNGNYLGC